MPSSEPAAMCGRLAEQIAAFDTNHAGSSWSSDDVLAHHEYADALRLLENRPPEEWADVQDSAGHLSAYFEGELTIAVDCRQWGLVARYAVLLAD